MCLMLLVSGIVTTATFTLMMQCSKRAPSRVQASHYTTLATLEVVGKLLFSVSLGSVTDAIGYENVFILFLVLTTLVISFLQSCPQELIHHQEEVSVKDKSEWLMILLSNRHRFKKFEDFIIMIISTGDWVSVLVRYSYVYPSQKGFPSWYFKIITVNQSTLSYNSDCEIMLCNPWMFMLDILNTNWQSRWVIKIVRKSMISMSPQCECMWM